MTRIALCGLGGRMGQTLRQLVEQADDLVLAGGVDRDPLSGEAAERLGVSRVCTPDTAGALLAESDVIIDFSAPAALRALLEQHSPALAGRALVVGTTGLGEREEQLLASVAERAPVLVAANFSIGVNLLLQLVATTARVLAEDRFDIEVVEVHHRKKVDAPSGTALALAAAAANARSVALGSVRNDGRSGQVGARPVGEIGLHAVRGGGVVGEHRVHFLGEHERVELAHQAADRGPLAEGALLAARWLIGRSPGRYHMSDVLGFQEP